MSEECCGPNEPRKPGTVRRIELSRPLSTGDACCAAEPSSKTAAPSAVHDAGDACCGPDLATTPTEADEEPEVRPPWWRDFALLPSALSGLFLGLALAIIVALFPLALFGILGLAGVVLVHEIAEVVVILNGVRAARRPAALRQLATVPARQPEPAHA
ncbi:MAG: hypothetical protein ABGX78_13760 [Microbacterium sp.]|uniref:hypothetical protein n=1 Tax=Microbacterium sp. TaxID=51671 RepID=UPI003242ED89